MELQGHDSEDNKVYFKLHRDEREHINRLERFLNVWEELDEEILTSANSVSNDENDRLLNDRHEVLEAMQDVCNEFSDDLRTSQINMLPTYEYNVDRSCDDQASCAVCISDLVSKELMRKLPCGHNFHAECLDKWLQSHETCPMCRTRVIDGKMHIFHWYLYVSKGAAIEYHSNCKDASRFPVHFVFPSAINANLKSNEN
uniref:RING-type domain-containing protein n=1 Tax=Glossina austeni TaxID=7395 RepID=A0A1A9UTB3_GLOAU